MRQGRWIAAMLLGMGMVPGVSGCFTGGIYQVPDNESLATDLTAESTPRLARAQQIDPSEPKVRTQFGPVSTSSSPPPPPLPADSGISQTSLKNVRVSVRAWVNGKP